MIKCKKCNYEKVMAKTIDFFKKSNFIEEICFGACIFVYNIISNVWYIKTESEKQEKGRVVRPDMENMPSLLNLF